MGMFVMIVMYILPILGEVSRRGVGVLIPFRLYVRQLCLYTCYRDDLIVFPI